VRTLVGGEHAVRRVDGECLAIAREAVAVRAGLCDATDGVPRSQVVPLEAGGDNDHFLGPLQDGAVDTDRIDGLEAPLRAVSASGFSTKRLTSR